MTHLCKMLCTKGLVNLTLKSTFLVSKKQSNNEREYLACGHTPSVLQKYITKPNKKIKLTENLLRQLLSLAVGPKYLNKFGNFQ